MSGELLGILESISALVISMIFKKSPFEVELFGRSPLDTYYSTVNRLFS